MAMLKRGFVVVGLLFLGFISLAQEEKESKITVDNGIDFVSSYLFRGVVFDKAPHIQGWAALSSGNFSIGLWGTANVQGTYVETDFYLSYSASGFGILITDYHGGLGENFFDFDSETSPHTVDLTLTYELQGDFPLSFEYSSLIYGYDPKIKSRDPNTGDPTFDGNNYSTYLGLAYPLEFNETSVELSLGLLLMESYWYGTDELGLTNIGIKTSKTYKLSDTFSFTGFFQMIMNPSSEQAMVAVGVNF